MAAEQVVINADDAKKAKASDLFKQLKTSRDGLSHSEADNRLKEYGPNTLIEKRVHPVLKFLGYFWGPIPWMIEAAAGLSAVVRHWVDLVVISILLFFNAIVGFWQERKADTAIESLKKRLAPTATVKRDGKWREIEGKNLVPGDIVRVRLGHVIPADIKLIGGNYLQVDESALTGESLPVEKQKNDVAYSGSLARQGEMDGVVFATGANTFFGKTAKLVAEAKTESHFQKAVIRIGDFLIVLAIIFVGIVIAVSLYRGESFLRVLEFALVLTVASIPVAMPAVLSVTMAIGATALAKKEAIVSKLVSIEEMAGMDVLCSDKTGTITQNKMTIGELIPFGDFKENDILLNATLASREEDKDPIDDVIIAKSKDVKEVADAAERNRVLDFKPFDPVKKRTEATLKGPDGKQFKTTKGAPQVILNLAAEKGSIQKEVEKNVKEFASKGHRSLGVARADNDTWHFVGLIGMFDPPREDSAATIRTAEDMGVMVKMVTGDHTDIAIEIAKMVGMGSNILPASEIEGKRDEATTATVEAADGFAQVYPEHKYHIVELLQKRGHIVGMTGDGVNDAPALKKADVGIAVEGSTDAAKSAAAIVLTKPGLSVIIDAIKHSRRIFKRMTSYSIYRIAETIRVLFFIVISILAFNFFPVTALMIVLLALFNDGPIMTIAYDKARYSNSPEKWNFKIVLGLGTYLGVIGVIFSFILFFIGRDIFHLNDDQIRTYFFLNLAVAGNLTIFLSRTVNPFWSIAPGKALFWGSFSTKIIVTVFVLVGILMTAINWWVVLFIWVFDIVVFVLTDLLKVPLYRRLERGKAGEAEKIVERKGLKIDLSQLEKDVKEMARDIKDLKKAARRLDETLGKPVKAGEQEEEGGAEGGQVLQLEQDVKGVEIDIEVLKRDIEDLEHDIRGRKTQQAE
jgi:H+-transporting ATPase